VATRTITECDICGQVVNGGPSAALVEVQLRVHPPDASTPTFGVAGKEVCGEECGLKVMHAVFETYRQWWARAQGDHEGGDRT
jgi:hypothetical protein